MPGSAIVCPFEPNDSEPRLGVSLDSSCACINLPRKGELLLTIMFSLAQEEARFISVNCT